MKGLGLVGTRMLDDLKEQIKKAFGKIKLELNDYRECINENTNEIQANYEYLCRLDSKMEKLSERIEELTLFMDQLAGKQKQQYHVEKLTRKEQEVFMVLYAQEEGGISSIGIGRRIGLTADLVCMYVSNLVVKGVPIIKQIADGTVQYFLDKEFRTYQAKENILNINEDIAISMRN